MKSVYKSLILYFYIDLYQLLQIFCYENFSPVTLKKCNTHKFIFIKIIYHYVKDTSYKSFLSNLFLLLLRDINVTGHLIIIIYRMNFFYDDEFSELY